MKSCYKLGELIRNVDVKNKDLHCNNLRGLSMTKEFRPSTSNIVGTDLSKYKIVAQKQFACDFMSTIRVHKMPIAFNTGKEEILVSPAYAVFEVVDEKIILPEYLMMWFSRTEFDRYADFRSDAAIRGGFGWNELCETSISIPCITDQYKIVFEYQAITERIALKQKINDNLAATIQTIFLSCKQSDTFKTYLPLNELVKTVNFRNKDNVYGIDDLMGVSLTKEFIKSPANTISLDVSNYKIVKPFQFACNLMHVGRDKKVAVGMLTDADNVIISPAFTVFEIINNNVILPEVLVSWFSQSFFDNEVSYLASEGIRDGIKWDTFAKSQYLFLNLKFKQRYKISIKTYNRIS